MLITPEVNRRNRWFALVVAALMVLAGAALAMLSLWWLLLVPLAGGIYYWIRKSTLRRLKVMAMPFPESWEAILIADVQYFVALNDQRKEKFRHLVKVFLDEVAVTGIRTEVDERTRVLVAASAVIPILGFDDWEYSGLGEVLIYPGTFSDDYKTDEASDPNILGMVGTHHLSGVMILSKPSLIAGFAIATDKRNVGIHEFAHLVDKANGDVDGVPPAMDAETFEPWIRWIGEELRREVSGNEHIDDYAYTDEAEYFAVLSEYFFEAPALLEQKNPQLYQMLQAIYHQNPKRILGRRKPRRRRVGRNEPCPCGSDEKFKRCCRRKAIRGMPKPRA